MSPKPTDHKSQIDQIGRLLGSSSPDARFFHILIALGKIGHAAQAALPTLRACLGLQVPGLFEAAGLAFQRIYPINSPADALLARLIPKAYRSKPIPTEIVQECLAPDFFLEEVLKPAAKIAHAFERYRCAFEDLLTEAVLAFNDFVCYLCEREQLRETITLLADPRQLRPQLVSRIRSRYRTAYGDRRLTTIQSLCNELRDELTARPALTHETREFFMKLQEAVADLNPLQRSVIEAAMNGQSAGEIATELAIQPMVVYRALENARRNLRKRLSVFFVADSIDD